VLSLLCAKTLVLNGQYQAAADLLIPLKLLPCEGSTDARATLREADLMLALQPMKTGSYDAAMQLITDAREWPENLGAGKPYAEDLDERLEDWLTYECNVHSKPQVAQASLERILAFAPKAKTFSAGSIIRALTLKEAGRTADAEELINSLPASSADEKSMAVWGKEIFAGHATPLPDILQTSETRILSAWRRQSTNQ
jgi:hypothetical protein